MTTAASLRFPPPLRSRACRDATPWALAYRNGRAADVGRPPPPDALTGEVPRGRRPNHHDGMCHADDSLPPLPPVSGGARDIGDTTLTASDGNRLMAYYAHPDGPSTTGMIVMPDVRGLHHFYKDLARRFAEAGHHSIAVDYFGRTADTED